MKKVMNQRSRCTSLSLHREYGLEYMRKKVGKTVLPSSPRVPDSGCPKVASLATHNWLFVAVRLAALGRAQSVAGQVEVGFLGREQNARAKGKRLGRPRKVVDRARIARVAM